MKKIVLSLIFLSVSAVAQIMPKIPDLTQPVTDLTGKLHSSEVKFLDSEIRHIHRDGQGPQIAILIIPTLADYPLEDAAYKIFNTWKLGSASSSDGVLILVVLNDRKMRIEVGDGLEGSLTDYDASNIIRGMGSFFRNQEYASGLVYAVHEIGKIVTAPDAVQTAGKVVSKDYSLEYFLLFLFGSVILMVSQVVIFFSRVANNVKTKDAIDKIESEKGSSLKSLTHAEAEQSNSLQQRLTQAETVASVALEEFNHSDYGQYSRLENLLERKESQKRALEREAAELKEIIRVGV